ncbi:hypothetical protein EDD66_102449 [Mobilisporobacter senegalensis]|uniref:Flagellar Assembly Protein A N-terminal region domain-containing protein n=1 Tax=Mobilisporobacter senegalensis TaxID=1329262 RepID=A0A3N1XVY3_9FIRM|nr:FapA family protein [Mobilisporobacter senegalensis]ROR30794.1 hypothetical protein EDD66_102449 [Mobilisporobacter senegalensis]
MMYKNGFFQLSIKNDGIYMKIFPAMNGGAPLKFDEVSRYLTKKRIMDYDIKTLHDTINKAKGPIEVKIGNQTVLPENESVEITISSDRMTVFGRFYPPSTGGKTISSEEVLNDLVHAGVKHGILNENIEAFFKNRQYCTDIILAAGTPPEKGHDAKIIYHFNISNNAKPKINEDGSVDFHQLDVISKVKAGDILATLEPVVYGKPGMDVLGKTLPPDKVVNRILRYGKNIHLSEDGCIMYTDVSGHVKLENDKVVVADTYDVNGDVNTSTGDINYDGNVHIRGNVITGFSVKAKGDIEVDGVVEGATLIAEGKIILRRGIQGMSRGKLEAQGDVITKFIESCEVISGSNVTAGAILHSNVTAKGEINVNGRNGSVTGGTLRSSSLISVKSVGSTMGTSTTLEVGIDPILVDELHTLEKDIPAMINEKEKLLQVVTLLQKKMDLGEKLTADKLNYLQIASKNSLALEENIEKAKARFEDLKVVIENTEGGKVRVSNIAYPGVKIVISNVIYFVRSEQHYCQFLREGADILVKPY